MPYIKSAIYKKQIDDLQRDQEQVIQSLKDQVTELVKVKPRPYRINLSQVVAFLVLIAVTMKQRSQALGNTNEQKNLVLSNVLMNQNGYLQGTSRHHYYPDFAMAVFQNCMKGNELPRFSLFHSHYVGTPETFKHCAERAGLFIEGPARPYIYPNRQQTAETVETVDQSLSLQQ